MENQNEPSTRMEIKSADIRKLILDEDDFGHEMRVGAILADLAAEREKDHFNSTDVESPSHGGTYTDAITGKLRQFDYRCRVIRSNPNTPTHSWCALLAIECKNLHKSSPLVICGRPRTDAEGYYAVIETTYNVPTGFLLTDIKGVRGEQFYPAGQFVGKSLLRIRQKGNKNLEAVSDPDIYEKWSQAFASSVELAESACKLANPNRTHFSAMVLPIVVVPNDSLWTAEYDNTGCMPKDPQMVNECEYFIERRFLVGNGNPFVVTHVHFVTLDGLKGLLSRYWRHRNSWEWIFPAGGSQVTLPRP